MKKLTLFVAALMAVVGTAKADMNNFVRDLAIANVSPIANVINWRIGEYQDMSVSIQGMTVGNIHKEATSEEGNAIWLKQSMSGMMGNQVVEVLLDRADGHIIKMKQNGQEQAPPQDKMEIIDQETTKITVPAGTFDVIHVRAKSQQSGNIEVWMNPQAITLDGAAKMTMQAQGMPVAMELTKFGGR